jgi:hypothetical protein
MTAFANDAFSAAPTLTSSEAFPDAVPSIAPSISTDPTGMIWIAFRTVRSLMVMRQSAGDGLLGSSVWLAVGDLRTEETTRRLSLQVRKDLTGELSYVDQGLHLFLTADRFKVDHRDDGDTTISGNGRLQDGTKVDFAILGIGTAASPHEISISMNNGYWASGILARPRALDSQLHVVAGGAR